MIKSRNFRIETSNADFVAEDHEVKEYLLQCWCDYEIHGEYNELREVDFDIFHGNANVFKDQISTAFYCYLYDLVRDEALKKIEDY